MIKPLIYIAGALNAESAVQYIKNMSRMSDHGEEVRKLGGGIFVPGNDFLHGLKHGGHEYEDYFNNSLSILAKCDAMYLVPGWENSAGVNREIIFAKSVGIPVLEDLQQVDRYIKRPKILCIVGESGTGKTTAAEYIEELYGIKMIESHTDRAPRHKGERGHTFHSKEDFNQFKEEDMLAFTQWGDVRYCCLHDDVQQLNTYVIDERGYSLLRKSYPAQYNIMGFRIYRNQRDRRYNVGSKRVDRDKGRFILDYREFDFVYHNDGEHSDMYDWIDEHVMGSFFPEVMEEQE